MSDNNQPTRRQFFGIVGRGAGLLAVGGLGLHLVLGRDGEKVWQLDPSICDGCAKLNGDGKLSACSTECVLKMSAVKAVNHFSKCGYCRICPGYHDVNSPREKSKRSIHDYDTPMGRVCPYGAIIRRPVGLFDEHDYKNNFYEYSIDESRCTGCGKCVIECGKKGQGNGSLRLEVRHDLCVGCNQCAIAKACPTLKKADLGPGDLHVDAEWTSAGRKLFAGTLASAAGNQRVVMKLKGDSKDVRLLRDWVDRTFEGAFVFIAAADDSLTVCRRGPLEYYGAFYRDVSDGGRPMMRPLVVPEKDTETGEEVSLPCGPSPFWRLQDERLAAGQRTRASHIDGSNQSGETRA